MTENEFVTMYCTNSGVTVSARLDKYFVPLPCYCGDETCHGWAMIMNDYEALTHHMRVQGSPREESSDMKTKERNAIMTKNQQQRNLTKEERLAANNDPLGIIKCAAIKDTLTDNVFTMERPNRHHDIIGMMVDARCKGPIHDVNGGRYIFGFMTALEFVDRYKAGERIGFVGRITSEDLW